MFPTNQKTARTPVCLSTKAMSLIKEVARSRMMYRAWRETFRQAQEERMLERPPRSNAMKLLCARSSWLMSGRGAHYKKPPVPCLSSDLTASRWPLDSRSGRLRYGGASTHFQNPVVGHPFVCFVRLMQKSRPYGYVTTLPRFRAPCIPLVGESCLAEFSACRSRARLLCLASRPPECKRSRFG